MLRTSEPSLRSPLMTKYLSVFLFSLISISWSQQIPVDSTVTKILAQSNAVPAEPNVPVVVLSREISVKIDSQNRTTETYHVVYRVERLDDLGNWGQTVTSWEPWHQARPEFHVRVISPRGVVVELDPKTLVELPIREGADTFTDARAIGAPLPSLSAGSIVDEEITARDEKPIFSAGTVARYHFALGVPVISTRLQVSCASSLPFTYKLSSAPMAKVTESSNVTDKTVTVEIARLESLDDSLNYLPPDARWIPGIEFGTGLSWNTVATAYGSLIADRIRTEDVKSIVTSLHSPDHVTAMTRLLAELHKRVRYTGIEFGEAALIPQTPAETLKRKYGDCKDKAAVLVSMFRAAGIPAYLAVLNSDEDVNPALPGHGEFNHAIVYVPSGPDYKEYWIDATSPYSALGELPYPDHDRWALIVDDKTNDLRKTPTLTMDENVHREVRKVVLADFGLGSIAEVNEDKGTFAAGRREYWLGDRKKLEQEDSDYMKRIYLARGETKFEAGEATDLNRPFFVTLKNDKAAVAYTSLSNAAVTIDVHDVLDLVPKELREEEDVNKTTPRKTQRTLDWYMFPHTNEWRYEIRLPAGFKAAALPQASRQNLGLAEYSQNFSQTEGQVVAEFSFKLHKNRVTPEEMVDFRKKLAAFMRTDKVVLRFDVNGRSLILQGKVKEGLHELESLSESQPKNAMLKVRFSSALIDVGLGTKARKVAQSATELDPKSPAAFYNLGWVYEHDLIGRRLHEGFERRKAAEAFRKAKELSPEDSDMYLALNVLYELNDKGVRFGTGSELSGAVKELEDLEKLDPSKGREYLDRKLWELWYLERDKNIIETISTLPLNDDRRSLAVAAQAHLNGVPAAINYISGNVPAEGRAKVLTAAALLLMNRRLYDPAAELLTAAAEGQENASRLLTAAELCKHAKAWEKFEVPPAQPESALDNAIKLLVRSEGELDEKEIPSVVSKGSFRLLDPKDRVLQNQLRFWMSSTRFSTWPVAGDLFLGNASFASEGDAETGYRTTMRLPGTSPLTFYSAKVDGKFKLVAFGSSPYDCGQHILDLISKGSEPAARKWLDWARDSIRGGTGDDPLSGSIFARFWTKGQEASTAQLRLAAIALLIGTDGAKPYHDELKAALTSAANDTQREALMLALMREDSQEKAWPELIDVAKPLLAVHPKSDILFNYLQDAYRRSQRFDEAKAMIDTRLAADPNDAEAVEALSLYYVYKNDFENGQHALQKLLGQDKTTSWALNMYGWLGLFTPQRFSKESIESAERAVKQTEEKDSSALHTLAALYAESGKYKEARVLALKGMDVDGLAQPDSTYWFIFGSLAQAFGQSDAALEMYAKQQKTATTSPFSSFYLGKSRASELQSQK